MNIKQYIESIGFTPYILNIKTKKFIKVKITDYISSVGNTCYEYFPNDNLPNEDATIDTIDRSRNWIYGLTDRGHPPFISFPMPKFNILACENIQATQYIVYRRAQEIYDGEQIYNAVINNIALDISI